MTVSVPNAKLRLRRQWLLPVLLTWGVVGLPFAMGALLAALGNSAWYGLLVAAYFGGFLGMEQALRKALVHRSGELRADDAGLFLNGTLLVARKKLSYGHVVQDGERMLLRLVQRSQNAQPIDVEVADEAQANELLAAMFLDRTVAEYTMLWAHRRGQLKLGLYVAGPLLVLTFALMGLLIAIGRVVHNNSPIFMGLLMAFLATPVIAAVFGALASEINFAVGSDGVWVREFLIMRRFIPFREIVSVERVDREITIVLADGSRVEANHGKAREEDGANLVARVQAGIDAARAAPQHAADSVARNGRSIAEWIATASKRNERSANYRAQVVPPDELWRIVEDASANPTQRAGAALALRADLDDEGKARLRIAADTCAEQKLRVALTSMVTSTDDELAEALEPLEDAPASRRMTL